MLSFLINLALLAWIAGYCLARRGMLPGKLGERYNFANVPGRARTGPRAMTDPMLTTTMVNTPPLSIAPIPPMSTAPLSAEATVDRVARSRPGRGAAREAQRAGGGRSRRPGATRKEKRRGARGGERGREAAQRMRGGHDAHSGRVGAGGEAYGGGMRPRVARSRRAAGGLCSDERRASRPRGG